MFVVSLSIWISSAYSPLGLRSATQHKEGAANSAIKEIPVHLGNVAPNSQMTKDVTLVNDSSFPWTLSSIRSDCGCLMHSLESERIAPGEATVVKVTFTAPDSFGSAKRNIVVRFNEHAVPVHLISIDAFIEPWCYATPNELEFHSSENNSFRNITLHPRRGSAINQDRPPRTSNWLAAKFVSNDVDPDGRRTVLVQVKPSIPVDTAPGALNGYVIFESKTPEDDENVHVPVRMFVEPLIVAKPAVLFLGHREPEAEYLQEVVVSLTRNVDSSWWDRQEVSVSHNLEDSLKIHVDVSRDSGDIHLSCSFRMPSTPTFLSGQITVFAGELGSIVIPVAAKVGLRNTGVQSE